MRLLRTPAGGRGSHIPEGVAVPAVWLAGIVVGARYCVSSARV